MPYEKTAPAPGSDVTLAFSNLNLPREYFVPAGLPAITAARAGIEPKGTVEAHREVLHELGCFPGGYEITPTRALTGAITRQMNRGEFRNWEDDQLFATAIHQAWGSGILAGIVRSLREKSPRPAQLAYAVEGSRHSIRTMQKLDFALGGALGVPAVVLPEVTRRGGRPYDYKQLGFYECAAQVKPEVVIARGGYRRMHDSLWDQGVCGEIVDPHHIERASLDDPDYRLDTGWLRQDMEDAGTIIMGMHASAGRIDSKEPEDRQRSMLELGALLQGPEALGRTALGDWLAWGYGTFRSQREHRGMPSDARKAERHRAVDEVIGEVGEANRAYGILSGLARHPVETRIREEIMYSDGHFNRNRTIRVVPEIPYEGLAAYREGKSMSPADFISLHRTAAAHLMQFLGSQ